MVLLTKLITGALLLQSNAGSHQGKVINCVQKELLYHSLLSTSEQQKKHHHTFAIRFRNNWGKGGDGKYLLIHFNEKWFWGLLMRKTAAKTFEGLAPKVMKAYHKCHISKIMGIAEVGYAFEDCIENGGIALKMLFHHAQSATVAQRLTKNKDGKILVRRKGDVYFVDCNVTGSNEGSAKDPKFSLLKYFKHAVFPEIKAFIGKKWW